jgi:hypothetical protein
MEGEHVGPFNLGNPGEFTMLELAQVLYFSALSHCVWLCADKNSKSESKNKFECKNSVE